MHSALRPGKGCKLGLENKKQPYYNWLTYEELYQKSINRLAQLNKASGLQVDEHVELE